MSSELRRPGAAVRVEGLGKTYRISGSGYGYVTLRERLSSVAGDAKQWARRSVAPPVEDTVLLDALRDVSFTIEQGETVGFIGHNGAGKSTLLKVLCRITPPTSGWAEVRGRVGSLLEVGTGFHPELSGRENVFLNGAILGMTRHEIRQRFDEIVAFAEVERFVDMPIKRYSSGMTMRLAFAVAAHLRPEILIVDEVLAVGDAAFQRKSVGRMGEVAEEGCTVLFVSHNMAVIQSLCRRGIVLNNGRLLADAPIHEAVGTYLRELDQATRTDLVERVDRTGHGQVWVRSFEATSVDGGPLRTGGSARFVVELTGFVPSMSCQLQISNNLGQPVCSLDSSMQRAGDVAQGRDPRFTCMLDTLTLVPGKYRVDVVVRGAGHTQDEITGAATFEVEEGLLDGRPVTRGVFGDTVLRHTWSGPEP